MIIFSEEFTHTEVGDSSFLSLQQTIKHQIWLVLVEEHHLSVGVVSSWVKEILEETIDAVKVNIAADYDELSLGIHLKQKKIEVKIVNFSLY